MVIVKSLNPVDAEIAVIGPTMAVVVPLPVILPPSTPSSVKDTSKEDDVPPET